MASITVLGGGVNGITTALACRLLGHDVTLVTRHRADAEQGAHHPRFASLYPAASVIPHAVHQPDVTTAMRETQRLFETVRQSGTCGVRLQPHYEIFESPEPDPEYAPVMHGYRTLPADGSGRADVPVRPGADAVFGWSYRVYFVETPTYLRQLYALFARAGGQVNQQIVTPENLATLPGDVLVNCLGAGALDVVDDPVTCHFLRGCLVYADPPGPALHRTLGTSFSINYTPSADVYPTPDGTPGGLYVYPRSDVWVLGGTKRPGRFGSDGRWEGAPVVAPTREVDGVTVPEPVVDVNAQLLNDVTGVDVRTRPLRATFGYRFLRGPLGKTESAAEDGIRHDVTTERGRRVVHNYGHGGAGVTLSWSSAVTVQRRLIDEGATPSSFSPNAKDTPAADPSDDVLLQRLRETLWGILKEE